MTGAPVPSARSRTAARSVRMTARRRPGPSRALLVPTAATATHYPPLRGREVDHA
jgi:hypothetical protein